MASILRSSKFVRYIVGFARNVVVNTPREFDGNLINSSQCICGSLSQSFASQASTQHDHTLEKSLRRIDQDVRRSGRISRRDIEDVLEEIRNSRTATSSQSLLVIRCCGSLVPDELPETRTKLVQEIWDTLKKLDVPMDISHYNALLRVYLENEHPFSPTDFLGDLEAKGIEPNRVTYQRLIARYCQEGDIDGATKILEYMKEKQLPVNENVFNALIVGHSEAGDMDSAHGIINVMTQAGLEPSADTYTTLLCGYAKQGDIQKITNLCDECESKVIILLDKDYLDIVYALAINGHGKHIPTILDKLRKTAGFNQDAVNLILKLINKGHDDEAFEVLKIMSRLTRQDGTLAPSGTFLIRQLVKTNKPAENILKMVDQLEKEGLHDKGLILAVETSLTLANEKLAFALLTELKNRNFEIREHFFWPLLASKRTNEEIIAVLQQMQSFNVRLSVETIRDYVVPNVKGKSIEIIEVLRNANISVGSSASSLALSLLQRNEIKEAALITRRIECYYSPELFKRPLVNAFVKTQDVNSLIQILAEIYENLDRKSTVMGNDERTVEVNKPEVAGNVLEEIARHKTVFNDMIEDILTKLVEKGFTISTKSAEQIQEALGEKMTDNLSDLLGKLTSGELVFVREAKKGPSYVPASNMNVAQLERLIQNLTAKGLDVKGHRRQLLTLYYWEKDLEKTEKLLAELENEKDFNYTPGIYAQLLDLYGYHENVEKALYYYEKLRENETESLSELKLIRLAYLLCKCGRFDEGLKLIEDNPNKAGDVDDKGFTYSALVWRFLNHFAEQGKVEDLDTIFTALVNKNYITITNTMLGPLVKVHLTNKDLDKALDKFEDCVTKFKLTPYKNELACQLIQKEDAEKLQKLTDLSTLVHGEINSLYDLVFAFVECGRVRQARRILETPGLQNRPHKINNACERFQQEGNIVSLEGLKDATKDLNYIDRSDIYYQLLLSYIKQDDGDKALGLWTQMQEEDLPPTDLFLNTLGSYLQGKNLEVPFVIPSVQKEALQKNQKFQKTDLQLMKQSLRNSDLDKALHHFAHSDVRVSLVDASSLIEKLVQRERIEDATQVVLKLLTNKVFPVQRIFKFYLNKLAATGDVKTLEAIDKLISIKEKKLISFDNRLCHANLVAGKADDYLAKLDEEISSATEENLVAIGEKFPRGGAYGILDGHPELVEKYEALALKYLEKNISAPLNVLWTHYYIKKDFEKADKVWNAHLKNAPRIMFQRIVQTARDNSDEALIRKLIDHLKVSNVTEGAIGNAYSCLLDVVRRTGSDEHIIKTFEECLKEVSIDSLNKTAVLRIKSAYDNLGKPFNFKLPEKLNKSSSGSSSDTKKNIG